MLATEIRAERETVEAYMRSKGLAYVAAPGYEAHQIYCAMTTGGSYTSTVIARVRTDTDHDYFCWGFYSRDEAQAVAEKVKRSRKYYVMDVSIVDTARMV